MTYDSAHRRRMALSARDNDRFSTRSEPVRVSSGRLHVRSSSEAGESWRKTWKPQATELRASSIVDPVARDLGVTRHQLLRSLAFLPLTILVVAGVWFVALVIATFIP